MAAFIIAYDLVKEVQRPRITVEIHKNWDWAKLSESSYAITTNESANVVFERLQFMLDNDDRLYVVPIHGPGAGFGPTEVIDWLKNNGI